MSEQQPSALCIAYYGDDFTGSVDVLLQFARNGWTGRLFVGLPDEETLRVAARTHEVIGIAGIARSLRTEDIDAEVRPALRALAALDPSILQYKACSTADSSPETGSIGRVIEIGREIVGAHTVPLLFAQPDFGRYTVFGHHFASEGGVVYRLDRQPTMSTHPTTPMRESDLATHLGAQTSLSIGGIARTQYAGDLRARILEHPSDVVILDALDADDTRTVGAAISSLPAPTFAIGSGGLSWGIAAADPLAADVPAPSTPASGPVLAVSGSRSPQTRRQIDDAAAAGWLVAPLDFDDTSAQAERVLAALREGRSVALTSDDAPVHDGTLQAIAETAVVLIRAASAVTRRIIVAGGDTSGRVTRLLGVRSLEIAANPTGNIVLLRADSIDPAVDGIEMLLKGGQVGDDDLFESIRRLGAGESHGRQR